MLVDIITSRLMEKSFYLEEKYLNSQTRKNERQACQIWMIQVSTLFLSSLSSWDSETHGPAPLGSSEPPAFAPVLLGPTCVPPHCINCVLKVTIQYFNCQCFNMCIFEKYSFQRYLFVEDIQQLGLMWFKLVYVSCESSNWLCSCSPHVKIVNKKTVVSLLVLVIDLFLT